MENPTQASIARALGLTRSAVCKLARQGMPISSPDAARAWRNANVNAYMRPLKLKPAPTEPLDRVYALIPGALAALEAGRFANVEAELRQALRDVPYSHSGELRLPLVIFDALTADVLRVLEEVAAQRGFQPDGPLVESDAEFMPDFWWSVARGQIRAN